MVRQKNIPSKVCTKCRRRRKLDKFHRVNNKNFHDGRSYECKDCDKKYRASRSESNRVYQKQYRSTQHGRAALLLSMAKHRAKKAGVAFDLDVGWVETRLLCGKCELSGVNFIYESVAGLRGARAPSIDRIGASDGYTKDNCRVILWQINAAKQQWPDDDLKFMVRSLQEWANG